MRKPEFLPNGPDVLIEDTVLIDQPKVQITFHSIESIKSHFSTGSGIPNSLTIIFVASDSIFMDVAFVVYNFQV